MKRSQQHSRPTRALVTGGGTGIGRAIALAFAAHGVNVLVTGRQHAPLEAVVAEITARGGQAEFFQADLTQPAERAALIRAAIAQGGPPDVLVCNAGVMPRGPLTELTDAAIADALQLNLAAPLDLARQLQPTLRAVVLVGSQAGQVPLPYLALYGATKAGLMALGEALRYEWPAVQILIAAPPGTRTAMTAGLAAAAGWRQFPLLEADFVGERIVKALLAGRETVSFGPLHTLPVWLYRWWPGLVQRICQSQRHRFAKMFVR